MCWQWTLLKLWFVDEPRSEMLKFIGFQPPEQKQEDPPPPAAPPPAEAAPSFAPEQSAEDVFSSLAANAEEDSSSLAAADEASAAREQRAAAMGGDEPATVVPSESWASASDGESIKRALIVGDYEKAVECCLRAGRTADALVLAASRSEELWQKTRDRYLAVHQEPFMKVVANIKDKRLDSVVDSADLGAWQETLAILLTFADATQISTLAEELGTRLQQAGDARGANICFLCAGSVEKAAAAWAVNFHGGTDALQALIEKVCVFQKSTGQDGVDERTAERYCEYAETLAAQGRVDIAMKYMQKAGGGQGDKTALLVDRLYHNGAGASLGVAVPPTPYASTAIGAGRAPAAQLNTGAAPSDNFWPGAQAAPAPAPSQFGYAAVPPPAAPAQAFPPPAAPAPAPPPFQTFTQPPAAPAPAPVPAPVPVPAPAPPPFQTFDHGGGQPQGAYGGAAAPPPAGPPTGGPPPAAAAAQVFQPPAATQPVRRNGISRSSYSLSHSRWSVHSNTFLLQPARQCKAAASMSKMVRQTHP